VCEQRLQLTSGVHSLGEVAQWLIDVEGKLRNDIPYLKCVV